MLTYIRKHKIICGPKTNYFTDKAFSFSLFFSIVSIVILDSRGNVLLTLWLILSSSYFTVPNTNGASQVPFTSKKQIGRWVGISFLCSSFLCFVMNKKQYTLCMCSVSIRLNILMKCVYDSAYLSTKINEYYADNLFQVFDIFTFIMLINSLCS